MSAPLDARLVRLHPEPGEVSAAELIGALRPHELAPPDRPHVAANMITSLDGHATLTGRSGGLGGPADRALFHLLRAQVDAVLVGTRTVAQERYGRLARDPELRALRERAGLAPEPLCCLISRSGNVAFDAPLFAEPEARIALFTAVAPTESCAAQLEVVLAPPEALTPARVLGRLRAEHGIRSVLCEGGPTLLAGLLAEAALDELFLSLAPKLVGGGGPRIVGGDALPAPAELELAWILAEGAELFLRYRVRHDG